MNNNPNSMPRYQCHKKVWALKIANVELREDGADIYPDEDDYAPFEVGIDWVGRFKPTNGECGYYVVYDDGYASWSPSKAFEDGYTRILSAIIPAAKPAVLATDALIDARDCMSRAADIFDQDGRVIEAGRLRHSADLCRAALSGGTATPKPEVVTDDTLNDIAAENEAARDDEWGEAEE
jgi:hypothetical protein